MKLKLFSFFLILSSLTFIACTREMTVVAVSAIQPKPLVTTASPNDSNSSNNVNIQTSDSSKQATSTDNTDVVVNENFCQNPTPSNASICANLEEMILASTVRIELHRWLESEGKRGEYVDGGIGHATIKDGRYLVTHNHFSTPLDSIEGAAGEEVRISVFKANGEVILDSVQPSAFSIVVIESETIVLDFGEYVGDGLFGMLDMPSASFQNTQGLALEAGMEVAQINWNNEVAHVEWTNVRRITTTNGIPHIVLDNGVIKGASGGGIFWNGLHIANNWTSTTVQAADGELLDTFSAAALNSELITN